MVCLITGNGLYWSTNYLTLQMNRGVNEIFLLLSIIYHFTFINLPSPDKLVGPEIITKIGTGPQA